MTVDIRTKPDKCPDCEIVGQLRLEGGLGSPEWVCLNCGWHSPVPRMTVEKKTSEWWARFLKDSGFKVTGREHSTVVSGPVCCWYENECGDVVIARLDVFGNINSITLKQHGFHSMCSFYSPQQLIDRLDNLEVKRS